MSLSPLLIANSLALLLALSFLSVSSERAEKRHVG